MEPACGGGGGSDEAAPQSSDASMHWERGSASVSMPLFSSGAIGATRRADVDCRARAGVTRGGGDDGADGMSASAIAAGDEGRGDASALGTPPPRRGESVWDRSSRAVGDPSVQAPERAATGEASKDLRRGSVVARGVGMPRMSRGCGDCGSGDRRVGDCSSGDRREVDF